MANPTLNVWRGLKAPLDVWRGHVLEQPVVLVVSPASGSSFGGTTVTLSGYGFTGVISVLFGAVAGTITTVSDTSIAVTSPAGALGSTVGITVANATYTSATLPNAFSYVSIAPTLAATPVSGPWRSFSVTFAGANLLGATSATINGVAVTITGSTMTSVTVTTNAATANAGPYNVLVTTPSGNTGTTGNGIYSVLWDPIDSATNLWLNASVGVTTAGGNVTMWNDQSGFGNHAYGTGTWSVVTGFANGKTALLTDASTPLNVPTSSIFAAPSTACAVFAVVADSVFSGGSGTGGAVFGAGGSSQELNIHTENLSGFQWVYGDTTTVNSFVNNNRTPFASAVHCEWILNGGGSNLTHYIAGSVQAINSGGPAAGPQASSGSFASNTANIGTRGDGGHPWQRHILEIVCIRHVPNANELAGWTAYAKTKYGLAS